MADRKISDLTALTTPASGDFLPIVDISEVAAASKNKRITIEELMRGMPDGTAAAPSIAFESDPNTGIYSPGADQLAISTNGTGRLYIDASGNVGINAAAPSFTFDCQSSSSTIIRIKGGTGSAQSAALYVTEAGSVNTLAAFGDRATLFGGTVDQAVSIYTGANKPLVFDSGSSERMRLDSSGRLGLGTSSPARALTVNSSSGNINYVRLQETTLNTPTNRGSFIELGGTRSDGNYGFYGGIFGARANTSINNTGYLAFYSDNNDGVSLAERMRIDSAGNVGIGTASPATALDVNGDVTITDKIIHGGDTNTAIRFPAADTVSVETNGSERARIDSSGRLLVGTSTAYGSFPAILQTQNNNGYAALFGKFTNNASGADIEFFKGRGGSSASVRGIVQNNDSLGYMQFSGDDGVNGGIAAAAIFAQVDGTPGANDMPGRLVFSTTSDGAASPTERMRITSAGDLLIGGTLPSSPNASIYNNGQFRSLNRPMPQSKTFLKYATYGYDGQTLDVAAEIAAAVAGSATWAVAMVTVAGFNGATAGRWHGIYSNGPGGGGTFATELYNSGGVTLTGSNLVWPAGAGTGAWYDTYLTILFGSF